MNSSTIDCLRSEWQAIGASPASSLACQRLALVEPSVADCKARNLGELVVGISAPSGGVFAEESTALLAAMVRSAHCDALVPRAILQALVPAVSAMAKKVVIADDPWCGDVDAFFTDALSSLWEEINHWSGATGPYVVRALVRGTHTRLRTLQRSERRRRAHLTDRSEALGSVPAFGDRSGPELLATAIIEARAHGLDQDKAAALYATRVVGLSMTELASRTGISAVTLRRQRRVAVAQLVA